MVNESLVQSYLLSVQTRETATTGSGVTWILAQITEATTEAESSVSSKSLNGKSLTRDMSRASNRLDSLIAAHTRWVAGIRAGDAAASRLFGTDFTNCSNL